MFLQSPESVTMLSRHGQRYSCQLPLPAVAEEGEEEEDQRRRFESLPDVSALLQPMSGKECLIKVGIVVTIALCCAVREEHCVGLILYSLRSDIPTLSNMQILIVGVV